MRSFLRSKFTCMIACITWFSLSVVDEHTGRRAQLYTKKWWWQGSGTYGERVEREPITGVWGQSPQWGSRAKPLVGVRGRSPLKLKGFGKTMSKSVHIFPQKETVRENFKLHVKKWWRLSPPLLKVVHATIVIYKIPPMHRSWMIIWINTGELSTIARWVSNQISSSTLQWHLHWWTGRSRPLSFLISLVCGAWSQHWPPCWGPPTTSAHNALSAQRSLLSVSCRRTIYTGSATWAVQDSRC